MGWRSDRAYEEGQRQDFLRWRKSLTWAEYLAWQWGRHWHFLAGAVTAAGGFLLWRLLA